MPESFICAVLKRHLSFVKSPSHQLNTPFISTGKQRRSIAPKFYYFQHYHLKKKIVTEVLHEMFSLWTPILNLNTLITTSRLQSKLNV